MALVLLLKAESKTAQHSIIIDPAGNARTTGRIIGDSFERAVTYQLAIGLKKQLEQDENYTVRITRSPGENVLALQNAHFANRLNPDLYIAINCYDDPDQKFKISLYTMAQGNPFIAPLSELSFIPLHKAHWSHALDTKKISLRMYEALCHSYAHQFLIPAVRALPIAPLVAIQSPAISIELNCHTSSDSNQYIEPLIYAIKTALSS